MEILTCILIYKKSINRYKSPEAYYFLDKKGFLNNNKKTSKADFTVEMSSCAAPRDSLHSCLATKHTICVLMQLFFENAKNTWIKSCKSCRASSIFSKNGILHAKISLLETLKCKFLHHLLKYATNCMQNCGIIRRMHIY